MRIQLSDHFTYKRLLRFVVSPICMMIFTSLYSIIDGFFVSNYVGKTPFAALNLIFPVTMGIGTIGFMVGTGGSAIVSKTLGEGKKELASQYFSLLVYSAALFSTILSAVSIFFTPAISVALGAGRESELFTNCVLYGRILFAAEPFFVSKLFCHCGKTGIKSENISSFWFYKRNPGFCFYCGVGLGTCRRSLSNSPGAGNGCHRATDLLFPAK